MAVQTIFGREQANPERAFSEAREDSGPTPDASLDTCALSANAFGARLAKSVALKLQDGLLGQYTLTAEGAQLESASWALERIASYQFHKIRMRLAAEGTEGFLQPRWVGLMPDVLGPRFGVIPAESAISVVTAQLGTSATWQTPTRSTVLRVNGPDFSLDVRANDSTLRLDSADGGSESHGSLREMLRTLQSVRGGVNYVAAEKHPNVFPDGLSLAEQALKLHPVIYLKPADGGGGRGVVRVSAQDDGSYHFDTDSAVAYQRLARDWQLVRLRRPFSQQLENFVGVLFGKRSVGFCAPDATTASAAICNFVRPRPDLFGFSDRDWLAEAEISSTHLQGARVELRIFLGPDDTGSHKVTGGFTKVSSAPVAGNLSMGASLYGVRPSLEAIVCENYPWLSNESRCAEAEAAYQQLCTLCETFVARQRLQLSQLCNEIAPGRRLGEGCHLLGGVVALDVLPQLGPELGFRWHLMEFQGHDGIDFDLSVNLIPDRAERRATQAARNRWQAL